MPAWDLPHILRQILIARTGEDIPLFDHNMLIKLLVENILGETYNTSIPNVLLNIWLASQITGVAEIKNSDQIIRLLQNNYDPRPMPGNAQIYNWCDASVYGTVINEIADPDRTALQDDPVTLVKNYDGTTPASFWFRNQLQPEYCPSYTESGINGLPSLYVVSVDSLSSYQIEQLANGMNLTMWVVGKFANTSNQIMYHLSTGTNNRRFYGAAIDSGNFTVSYGNQINVSAGAADTNPHVFIMSSNGGGGGFRAWIDGGAPAASGLDTSGWNGTLNAASGLLAFTISTLPCAAGSLVGEWGISSQMGLQQIDNMTKYLGDKWGVSVSKVTA